MADLPGEPRAKFIRRMFARIAVRYDIANRWMTWGADVRWRRKVLDLAALPTGGMLLDVGTGTGDLALEALRRDRSVSTVGLDFTLEMLHQGKTRPGSELVRWINGDALSLPFTAEVFDAVVSGYLLRNVVDLKQAIAEQYRVLKPGGRMVCLDTTPLPGDIWHLPARLYVQKIIPMIGEVVAGDVRAYTYLPLSTRRFLTGDELAESLVKASFRDVAYQCLMGDTMAIHWGVKG